MYSRSRFLISIVTFYLLSVNLVTSVTAASLKFNPSSLSMKPGEKKTLTVVLDTEGKKAFGAVSTIKVASGSDIVKLNSATATSAIGFNEFKLSGSNSASRLSFTVIKEVGAYYQGTVNIATIELEALKNGTATLEFNTSDSEASTVADFDTNDEILTTRGTAQITVSSSSSNDDNDDDDDNDDNDDNDDDDDNDGGSNNSSGSSSNNTAVPTTGSEDLVLLTIFGLSFVGLSLGIKKVLIK